MLIDRSQYKILVIEDNPGDFTLVEDFLFEHIAAPKITRAISYKTADEVLNSNEFDIVLLDLSLEDKAGEELINDILKISKNSPVIVLTGFTNIAFGLKSLSLGVADYLLKDDLTSLSLYKSVIYSIERKKNIVELEQSESRYSKLFNFNPLPMWVFDPETLRFLDVNNATIDHYGYSRDEFLKMTLKDIRPKEEIPKLEKGIAEIKMDPNTLSDKTYIHQKKDGDLFRVEIQVSNIQYNGKRANFIIANDVTERYKYVKAIETQNERFKEISWMQSHVVRAPLARIMGLIPLFSDSETAEENRTILNHILKSATELDDIVKKIIDMSKIEDFPLAPQHTPSEKREG